MLSPTRTLTMAEQHRSTFTAGCSPRVLKYSRSKAGRYFPSCFKAKSSKLAAADSKAKPWYSRPLSFSISSAVTWLSRVMELSRAAILPAMAVRPANSERRICRRFPTDSGVMCSKERVFFATPSTCIPPLWAKALRPT